MIFSSSPVSDLSPEGHRARSNRVSLISHSPYDEITGLCHILHTLVRFPNLI